MKGPGDGERGKIEYEAVGFTIEVTPVITKAGKIELDLKYQRKTLRGRVPVKGVKRGLGTPIIDEQETQTHLILESGQVAKVAGFKTTQFEKGRSGQPKDTEAVFVLVETLPPE